MAKKTFHPRSAWRAYVHDADTKIELAAVEWAGSSEAGIWRGTRYMGTTLGIRGYDLKTGQEREIVAETFPANRCIVTIWHPSYTREKLALVSRSKGWVGNEKCDANTKRDATKWKAKGFTVDGMWPKARGEVAP